MPRRRREIPVCGGLRRIFADNLRIAKGRAKHPATMRDSHGRSGVGAAVIWAGLVGVSCAAAVGAGGAAGTEAPFYANTFEKVPSAAAMTDVGRALFFDASLSASGNLACATCHDPKHAYGPPNDAPVQSGGSDGRRTGMRAVPSLMYAQNIPPFTEHYFDDEGDDGIDQGPAGGRTWDGRAQSAHDQAQLPLFSAFEMANASADDIVARVARAGYAGRLREAFGATVFGDRALAFKAVLLSLETFQQSPSEFYPYTSKYDAWLRHESVLSARELRGLAAFNDPAKGNCARCHPSGMRKGAFPQFTDFGYAALGAPRNMGIPANSDPRYFDLGLCGPLRIDFQDKAQYCGLFRTPSLRNVATRRVFFHNGVFHRLDEAVRFYAERDTQPQKWYSRGADGVTMKFDDLPAAYRGNVDTQPPFGRREGDRPGFSAADIEDIVAFLNTLTDGFEPETRR
jgi:cytochrome c peroxidase